MTDLERLEEIVELTRRIAANNEATAARMLAIVRLLAQDVLALLDLAPDDPLRSIVVDGARGRARTILANFGDDRAAH
jgi:hypothetical protein